MSNKLDAGFVQGQSDNLPIVDIFMMSDYLSSHLKYTSAEIRGWKLQKSGRANYGDEAVGYVQLKRVGEMCTVKARITLEHEIKNKASCCTFVCNEKEDTVVNVECPDCCQITAEKGGCKHCVAFVMWLNRRSEELTRTEKRGYWAEQKLATEGTGLKFIKAKDINPQFTSFVDDSKDNVGQFRDAILQSLQENSVENQISRYMYLDN